ncbi:hypothetical protein [Nitratiruptor tergarcus]|uniref:Uncharacterized protein n=1 Tax=Nitratiruptor tergarcus DSM 16512 TaxID=1069081 RepID=A0A1W1WV74_9BACT|nr:hypothetical protein [Nitratiruptor tergarcus]SMC10177.1 hypothetical protein SAMN05660197_2019 [Nitratiruptor tergarcus DSM 16512]
MNKSLILFGIAIGSIFLILFIFFYNPSSSVSLDDSQNNFLQNSSSSEPSIKITLHSNKKKEAVDIKREKKKNIVKKKPIDTTIKAISRDHGGKYYIELIDPNPEDKNIKPTSNPQHYIPVTGKIDNSFFYLKVPKELLGKPDIKLRIIKRNTHEIKEIPATFMDDLPSVQNGERLNVTIDFNKNTINTKVRTPQYGEVSALPHI